MSFTQLLNSLHQNENTISDGLLTCAYSQLPQLLKNIGNYLNEHGITEQNCIAVECINSVPSALVLLYLFTKQHGFVLLPLSDNKELKPVPLFCSHRLTIKTVNKANAENALLNLAIFLNIEVQTHSIPVPFEHHNKLLLRTSGSMGSAKIVVHNQDSLIGSANNVIAQYQLNSEDRFTIPVPIFHLYGLGAEFLPAILLGANIDLQENTNLLKYLDRERRFKPTVAFITPNLCEMLLQAKKTQKTLHEYKVIVVSGQRIKEALFRTFDPLCYGRLVNQYGSSEMGPIAACYWSDDIELRATTIGQPMQNVSLDIREEGQLYCNHPYHFLGYLNESGEWLMQASEWHRTGDLAKQTDKGIIIVGRADNSINRSGYLVLLADIETRLEQLSYLSQAVVVTSKTETIQGQLLVACVILKENTTQNESEILNDCAKILPKYAIPDRILILQQLPLLPSGKTDQQALIALAEGLL